MRDERQVGARSDGTVVVDPGCTLNNLGKQTARAPTPESLIHCSEVGPLPSQV